MIFFEGCCALFKRLLPFSKIILSVALCCKTDWIYFAAAPLQQSDSGSGGSAHGYNG